MKKNWMLLLICASGLLASCADSGNIPFDPGPFDKEIDKAAHPN